MEHPPPPQLDRAASSSRSEFLPNTNPNPSTGLASLVLELLRPYRGGLALVFAAMLVQTAMSLAAPWPLKKSPWSWMTRSPSSSP